VVWDDGAQILGDSDCFRLSSQEKPVFLGQLGATLGLMRLEFLSVAPDIVDAILLNELPDHLTLFDLASDTPLSWAAQRNLLNLPAGQQTGESKLLGGRIGVY